MANQLTAERITELLKDYALLKSVLLQIDAKYSLSYNDVTLDFPESLGLVKLVYTRPTDAQLTAIAEEKLAAKYQEKQRVITQSYNNSKINIARYKANLQANFNKRKAELEERHRLAVKELHSKLVNNGISHSTTKTTAEREVDTDFSNSMSAVSAKYNDNCSGYDTKLAELTIAYNANCASLQTEMQNEIAALLQTLRSEEDKKQTNVQKYNSSVDEKEAKYKASCERALQHARQAEFNRALNAAKIYAQLGETGVANLKLTEKTEYCKMHFSHYTLTEARFVLDYDSFLTAQLGDRYSAFVLWVNQNLKD